MFQDEALRRLLEGEGSDTRVLFLDDLKFALYRHLAEALTGEIDPVFSPLAGQGRPDPLRLFELADHISGVFHNYAMNSDLWPRALEAGVLPPGNSADPAAFAWQSRLWNDLLTGNRGTLAGVLMDKLTRQPPRRSGPVPRLVLLGSAFLSRRAAAFLRAWADAGLVDVVHLLLLPAPAELLSQTAGRPWSSWGTFGRAFLEAFKPSEAPPPEFPKTALGRLQASLAGGRPFSGGSDATLEIASAPHPLRELEALRDRLLSALAEDPALEVHEVAVLAPDINVYAPFFDAVFGSDEPGRNLRFHVIDLDLGRENAWFRALDALLSLVSGTVDRPTLFALIDTPAFAEAWDDPDRELWLDYTETVSAWREEAEDGAPQSWSASWDRLFTGWFRTDGPDGVPPLDTTSSAFRSLGRFHRLVEELRTKGRETRRPRPFLEWIRFLDGLMAAFLAPGDGTGAVLAGRLRTLAVDAGPDEALPWAGFRAFVQDQIAHFPGRRGQLLTEGIHCSSLRPLRAVPFRFIAVLGLDEGRFPRQAPTPGFDLRRHEAGQDDVSSLALDRYSFWETLMAAQSRLYLSYHGRSAVDGSERPPSPVLADLLDYLEEGGNPWPVTRITVKDFSVEPGSVTWSPRTRRRALALARPQVRPAGLPPPPGVDESFPEVRSSEVVLAFTAPARFHLQRVRQVVLRDEDTRSVDDEEPWSLSFLDRQAWLQEGLRRLLAGGSHGRADEFLRLSTATGRVRDGVFAERDRRELEDQAERVRIWAEALRAEGWSAGGGAPRKLWSGRPWADAPDQLVRGNEVLVPRLLYSEKLPARTKIEAALRVLLDPAPARLATLTPRGEARVLTWVPDTGQTRTLAVRAEAFWREAAARPLPFYPDYLEAVADRRGKEDEPWERSLEESWRKVRAAQGIQSRTNLTNCPYARLAFPEEPEWTALAEDLKPWWDDLFLPLLGGWS